MMQTFTNWEMGICDGFGQWDLIKQFEVSEDSGPTSMREAVAAANELNILFYFILCRAACFRGWPYYSSTHY